MKLEARRGVSPGSSRGYESGSALSLDVFQKPFLFFEHFHSLAM